MLTVKAAFSSTFRYILNINTIWGWMILVSVALCFIRNYQPTATKIPLGELQPGVNLLTIRLIDADGKSIDHAYPLVLEGGAIALAATHPAANPAPTPHRPRLISAKARDGFLRLTWDVDRYGPYRMLLGNRPVAQGQVVKLAGLTDAAFEYAKKGFGIALGLVSSMVLCLGLMKVGEDAGIVQIVARIFHPVIRFLFPDVPREHPANSAILMNITTSILGLGNASTPFGLKAMQELESINPHKGVASNAQVMLLAYNTTGIALIPTTIIAVRKAAGCSDPFEIIGTSLLAGSIATIVAISMAKLLARVPFFSVQAALAEDAREKVAAAPPEDQA